MESDLETFNMPNPLIVAAVQLYGQILRIEDSSPPTQNSWKRCVAASSLEARFGLNINGLMENVFDAERDIPTGKPGSEIYKILKEFFKTTKDPPVWFVLWKEKKTDEIKAKLQKKSEGGAGDEDGETKEEAKPDAAASAGAGEAAASQAGGEQAAAAAAAAAAEAAAVEDEKFQIGDVVMGVATKAKDKWAQKCEIIDILARHYKVKMQTGTEVGSEHKFLHACVNAIIPEPDVAVATGQPQKKIVKISGTKILGALQGTQRIFRVHQP